MKNKTQRLVIYASDVRNITGRKIGTCYKILNRVRTYYGKKKKDLVTTQEFSEFTSIPEDLLREFMNL